MVPIHFICPNCHKKAELIEVESGVIETRICTGWMDEHTPETELVESHYDNTSRIYECEFCQNEPVVDYAAGETLKAWVDRHQSDPPAPFIPKKSVQEELAARAEKERQATEANQVACTVTNLYPPDEPNGDPELLP